MDNCPPPLPTAKVNDPLPLNLSKGSYASIESPPSHSIKYMNGKYCDFTGFKARYKSRKVIGGAGCGLGSGGFY